jgi:serine phosphatase RsbU (regulator of sigma subunit)
MKSLFIAGNILVVLFFLVTFLNALNFGGIWAPDIFWIALSPVLAFFFAGKKSGYFWAAITFVVFISYYVGELTGAFDLRSKAFALPLIHHFRAILLFTVLLVFMIAIFENIIDNIQTSLDRSNHWLNRANEELRQQKSDILDSINYAKTIQDSIINAENFKSVVHLDNFVYYKPRDIVSGDFFWAAKIDQKLHFAVADCTGHGVPGALLTVLGISSLNEITGTNNIKKPNIVLYQLRDKIISGLSQSGNDQLTTDGMDISYCIFDIDTNVLQWSGANIPLYIITGRDNQANYHSANNLEGEKKALIEIKPDKLPIGVYFGKEKAEFTSHTFELDKDDLIYLFSDGYADQMGGQKGKKFLYKNFKELLLTNADLSLEGQKTKLDERFIQWKSEVNINTNKKHEQIDDVCVVGIKI